MLDYQTREPTLFFQKHYHKKSSSHDIQRCSRFPLLCCPGAAVRGRLPEEAPGAPGSAQQPEEVQRPEENTQLPQAEEGVVHLPQRSSQATACQQVCLRLPAVQTLVTAVFFGGEGRFYFDWACNIVFWMHFNNFMFPPGRDFPCSVEIWNSKICIDLVCVSRPVSISITALLLRHACYLYHVRFRYYSQSTWNPDCFDTFSIIFMFPFFHFLYSVKCYIKVMLEIVCSIIPKC